MATAQLTLECRLGLQLDVLEGLPELGELPIDLIDRLEVLLVQADPCVARVADDGVVIIEPSEAFADLITAFRARKADLGVTNSSHSKAPVAGLDAATVSPGGGAGNGAPAVGPPG